ncbi:MAG: hypothetical protein ACR2HH_05010 [Chthoniobacterales bacterium]
MSLHRPGETALDEARLQEALRKTETDPELARWWSAEQALDEAIASKLATTSMPAGLKARLLSGAPMRTQVVRSSWSRRILAVAASIIVLGVLFSSWRGPFQPAVSLADYRGEMVSFIKVPPNLELESSDLTRLQDFLAKADAPARFALPKALQGYEPVGCRVLRFRGHDVSLICFKIEGGQLAHLFVADAKSVPPAGRAAAPVFAAEEDWMTATWAEGGHAYLLTVKGDRAAMGKFLGTS